MWGSIFESFYGKRKKTSLREISDSYLNKLLVERNTNWQKRGSWSLYLQFRCVMHLFVHLSKKVRQTEEHLYGWNTYTPKRSVRKCVGLTLGWTAGARVSHIQGFKFYPKYKSRLRRNRFQRILCGQDLL